MSINKDSVSISDNIPVEYLTHSRWYILLWATENLTVKFKFMISAQLECSVLFPTYCHFRPSLQFSLLRKPYVYMNHICLCLMTGFYML